MFFSILVQPLTPYHIANYFGNCHIILPIQHVLPGLKSFLLTVIKQLRLNLHYLVQGADIIMYLLLDMYLLKFQFQHFLHYRCF